VASTEQEHWLHSVAERHLALRACHALRQRHCRLLVAQETQVTALKNELAKAHKQVSDKAMPEVNGKQRNIREITQENDELSATLS
jgi:hypothetical protein